MTVAFAAMATQATGSGARLSRQEPVRCIAAILLTCPVTLRDRKVIGRGGTFIAAASPATACYCSPAEMCAEPSTKLFCARWL
jgi:hypothetical protein